jgi:hypothetical protein
MKGMIDQVEISIPCSDCGKRTKKTMKWVQSHEELICECGASIDLDKTEETQATRRLRKSLKRIAKTFKPKYL